MLVGVIAWMSGKFQPKVSPGSVQQERMPASGRTVVPVERFESTETAHAVGTVQPRHKTDVASQVLAVIREIKVSAGDRVEGGQALIVLDDRELQAQLREVEAAATGWHVPIWTCASATSSVINRCTETTRSRRRTTTGSRGPTRLRSRSLTGSPNKRPASG